MTNTMRSLNLYQLRILSLGAGVQSTALYLMSCKGILPKLHAAIFADTGWESFDTYLHLEWLESLMPVYGIPIIRVVENAGIRNNLLDCATTKFAAPPFYIKNKDGSTGMSRRQCTSEYKLRPIRRQIRAMLELRPQQRSPQGAVETWVGISTDEQFRAMRYKPDRLQTMAFPLIDLDMNRHDCIKWISLNFPGHVPKKSSCIGCPYHTTSEWRNLSPDEFRDACMVDEAIRTTRLIKGDAFLHRSCRPLSEIDFIDHQLHWYDTTSGSEDRQIIMLSGLASI